MMRRLLSLLIGLGVLGASFVLGVPAANAATSGAGAGVAIEGEAWSSPAFPVECTGSQHAPRISCEPTSSADIKEEYCFGDVGLNNGSLATVCSTYDGNRAEIERSSESGVLSLEYGCQFGDAACLTAETASRAMSTMVTGGLAWAIGNASFNTDGYLWDAAIAEWSWWQGVTLIVILIAGIVSLVMSLWSRDRAELVKAFVRFGLALPASMFSVWMLGNLANVVDDITQAIIGRDEGEGLYLTIQNMVYNTASGNFFMATGVLTLFTAATVVLLFVFSFRNFALASLIALGPVAFMLFPTSFGVQWVVRWASAVTALLLTTPLTLGVMMLVLRGFGTVDTLWSIQAIPLAIGLLMLLFAPMAVFGLFSFAGNAIAGSVAENGAGNMGRAAMGKVQGAGRAGMRAISSTGARSAAARTAMQQNRTPSSGGGGDRPSTGPSAGGGQRRPNPGPGGGGGGGTPQPRPAQPTGQSAAPAPRPAPAPSAPSSPPPGPAPAQRIPAPQRRVTPPPGA